MKTYYIVFYSFMLFGLSVNISCSNKPQTESTHAQPQTDAKGRIVLHSESSSSALSLEVEESDWFFPDIHTFYISKQKLSDEILKRTRSFQSLYNIRKIEDPGLGSGHGISFSVRLKENYLAHQIQRSYSNVKCRVTFDYGGESVVNLHRTVLSFENCSSKEVFFENESLLILYEAISSF